MMSMFARPVNYSAISFAGLTGCEDFGSSTVDGLVNFIGPSSRRQGSLACGRLIMGHGEPCLGRRRCV